QFVVAAEQDHFPALGDHPQPFQHAPMGFTKLVEMMMVDRVPVEDQPVKMRVEQRQKILRPTVARGQMQIADDEGGTHPMRSPGWWSVAIFAGTIPQTDEERARIRVRECGNSAK